ncbi:MAG: 2-C-methyl-D-erythritol 4-phosphate cytidylyltransferase [Spirochaetes bacterium]|nr:2-C-methyl-D-erythritol 4-phosphate cytidylyltransferase [Spirochaetota bacterium]
MQNIYAIILAGGLGTRIKNNLPKQFLLVAGKPVIIRTLEKFSGSDINGIILVIAGDYIEYMKKLIKKYNIYKVLDVIPGGETRQRSSYNAIKCRNFSDDDILIFHDAARPFVAPETINNCIKSAKSHGASGTYVNAVDTIAVIKNNSVQSIPSRYGLYYTQTPQTFKYRIIKKAHELAISKGIMNATDDVQLVMDAGYDVKSIEGTYNNIKITTEFDLKTAEFISLQTEK